jgi:hypothetical protein
MDRELTYQMPFERLVRLSRSASRKAHATSWFGYLAAIGLFCTALALIMIYDEAVQDWQRSVGLPWFAAFAIIVVVYVAALWTLRRYALRQMKGRANYDSDVRMRQDDGGLRFVTDQVEYYLKWPGISQMLMEKDGVAVSHGSLFFLIPNTAFTGLQERDAFVRAVFGRLGAEARARSEKHVGSVLAESIGAKA